MGTSSSARKNVNPHECTITQDESQSFLPPLQPEDGFFRRWKRALRKMTLISEYNPQTTEYYRSKTEVLLIRKEQVESGSIIIHPFSMFRAYYEVYYLLILIVVLFYFPANAAFDLYPHSEGISVTDVHSEYHKFSLDKVLLRACLFVDIVLNFLTGYPKKSKRNVVMKCKKIAKNYIFSIYFLSDVIIMLPPLLMIHNHNIQRIATFKDLLIIVRIPTLFLCIKNVSDLFKLKNMTFQILKYFVVTYIVFHWFTCIQFVIPQLYMFSEGEMNSESWIIKEELQDVGFFGQYVVSLYRVSGSIFCINFTLSQIDLWEEVLVQIVIFTFGKMYVFYITVFFIYQLLKANSLNIKYHEIISQVQAYMSQKRLPIHLQMKLLQFYDYKYNQKFYKEQTISNMLSDKLRSEINVSVCSKLVQSVTLLAHLPQQSLEQIVSYLKAEVYLPHDIIIKAGSVGDCMYFLASGTVSVWTPSGKEVCHLQDGAYFGEISLVLKDKRRTANIIAIEICEVYKLERRAFKACFKGNVALLQLLETVAHERLEITQIYEDVHAQAFLEK